MHDDDVGLRDLEPIRADAVVGEVLVDARDAVEVADPLALYAQGHDHIGIAQAIVQIVDDIGERKLVRVGRHRGR